MRSIHVKAQDGQTVTLNFPDETPQAIIDEAVRRDFGVGEAPRREEPAPRIGAPVQMSRPVEEQQYNRFPEQFLRRGTKPSLEAPRPDQAEHDAGWQEFYKRKDQSVNEPLVYALQYPELIAASGGMGVGHAKAPRLADRPPPRSLAETATRDVLSGYQPVRQPSPAEQSARVFEEQYALEQHLLRSPEGRALLARQLAAEQRAAAERAAQEDATPELAGPTIAAARRMEHPPATEADLYRGAPPREPTPAETAGVQRDLSREGASAYPPSKPRSEPVTEADAFVPRPPSAALEAARKRLEVEGASAYQPEPAKRGSDQPNATEGTEVPAGSVEAPALALPRFTRAETDAAGVTGPKASTDRKGMAVRFVPDVAEMRKALRAEPGGEGTFEGTVIRAAPEGTTIRLADGTEQTVPTDQVVPVQKRAVIAPEPPSPQVQTEPKGTDAVILAAVDKAIDEGGGWANMKRLPGGRDTIYRFIDQDILEESGGFVRRKQKPSLPSAETAPAPTVLARTPEGKVVRRAKGEKAPEPKPKAKPKIKRK